jgi:hypothetical protein
MQNYFPTINIYNYLDDLPKTNEDQTNEDFFDNRIAEIIAVIELNQKTNNMKADYLKIVDYSVISFLFILLLITLQIILQ